MHITFAAHLQDQNKTNVFWHGYNGYNGENSPYKWGRANGWAIRSQAEALFALRSFPGHPLQPQVLEIFEATARGLKEMASWDGRWYQVVDHNVSFSHELCFNGE